MGLMFARRRADSAKKVKANKSKAAQENHRRAKIAAQAGVHPSEIQIQEQKAKVKKAEDAKAKAAVAAEE